jgi:hypothetical protein
MGQGQTKTDATAPQLVSRQSFGTLRRVPSNVPKPLRRIPSKHVDANASPEDVGVDLVISRDVLGVIFMLCEDGDFWALPLVCRRWRAAFEHLRRYSVALNLRLARLVASALMRNEFCTRERRAFLSFRGRGEVAYLTTRTTSGHFQTYPLLGDFGLFKQSPDPWKNEFEFGGACRIYATQDQNRTSVKFHERHLVYWCARGNTIELHSVKGERFCLVNGQVQREPFPLSWPLCVELKAAYYPNLTKTMLVCVFDLFKANWMKFLGQLDLDH